MSTFLVAWYKNSRSNITSSNEETGCSYCSLQTRRQPNWARHRISPLAQLIKFLPCWWLSTLRVQRWKMGKFIKKCMNTATNSLPGLPAQCKVHRGLILFLPTGSMAVRYVLRPRDACRRRRCSKSSHDHYFGGGCMTRRKPLRSCRAQQHQRTHKVLEVQCRMKTA